MRRLTTLIGVPVALAALCSCSVNVGGLLGSARHEAVGSRSVSAPHRPGSGMAVFARNGTVEVLADPARTDVSVEAALRCHGASDDEARRRLEATLVTAARKESGVLEIRATFPVEAQSGDGVSFRVLVPDATGVVIDTSNGWVKTAGLAGELRIDTSNGTVDVAGHAGDVLADTSNGTVTVSAIAGSLVIDTSNAGVAVADVAGQVDIHTSNGAVRVTLADGQAGPLTVKSSNAAVVIQATEALETIDLQTSNGTTRVIDEAGIAAVTPTSKTSCRVAVGDPGRSGQRAEVRSHVRTSNANVELEIATPPR